jgi:hypothetical protein
MKISGRPNGALIRENSDMAECLSGKRSGDKGKGRGGATVYAAIWCCFWDLAILRLCRC